MPPTSNIPSVSRNFWLTLDVDGVRNRVETGPQAKDGGFTLTIKQRDGGSIIKAMEIWGHVTEDGRIILQATGKPGTMGELDREITVETVR